MDEVLRLLPEGVSLYKKTRSVSEPWEMVVVVLTLIGLIMAAIGLNLILERIEVGKKMCAAGIMIMVCAVIVGNCSCENTYKVSISENADIDKLEENYNIIEKDDFIWTIELKDTAH